MSSLLANLRHVLGSRDPSVEQRRVPRDLVDLDSALHAGGHSHAIRIINLSPLGLMGRSDAALHPGDRITIHLPVIDDRGAIVRWTGDGRIGVEFIEPVAPDLYARMMHIIPPRRTMW